MDRFDRRLASERDRRRPRAGNASIGQSRRWGGVALGRNRRQRDIVAITQEFGLDRHDFKSRNGPPAPGRYRRRHENQTGKASWRDVGGTYVEDVMVAESFKKKKQKKTN